MSDSTLVQDSSAQVTDEVTSAQPTDTSTDGDDAPTKPVMSYDELHKRHNGLMSSHQKNLNRLRALESEKSEWENRFSDYQTRFDELVKRFDGLEKSRSKTQDAEPDVSQMDIKTYTDYVQQKAVEKAMQQWEEKQNSMMESQRQEAMQAQIQQHEQKFQSRWDELLKTDPSINIQEVENFMMESRVFDPVYAYNIMYGDLLTKQATTQAAKDTVEKIAKNQANFTEGAGKAGVIPKEKKPTTQEDRKRMILEGLQAANQGRARY